MKNQNKHLKVSVAMTTYNGELFLQNQLQSIAAQSSPPDELVVCDDASEDSTLAILNRFAKATSFPVFIIQNKNNVGTTKNISNAICNCKGDIVFLADQDDVWRKDKIETTVQFMEERPYLDMVFTDADVIGSHSEPLGHTLWDAVGFTHRRQKQYQQGQALPVILEKRVVTGATMAFRSEWRKVILPFPDTWVHDAWISLLISALGSSAFITEPLTKYREHGKNQIGAQKKVLPRVSIPLSTIARARRTHKLSSRLIGLHDLKYRLSLLQAPAHTINLIAATIDHTTNRQRIISANRLQRVVPILDELRDDRYRKHSHGNFFAITDLLC